MYPIGFFRRALFAAYIGPDSASRKAHSSRPEQAGYKLIMISVRMAINGSFEPLAERCCQRQWIFVAAWIRATVFVCVVSCCANSRCSDLYTIRWVYYSRSIRINQFNRQGYGFHVIHRKRLCCRTHVMRSNRNRS